MANERHPIIAHGELYVEPISKKSNYTNKSYPHEYEEAKTQLISNIDKITSTLSGENVESREIFIDEKIICLRMEPKFEAKSYIPNSIINSKNDMELIGGRKYSIDDEDSAKLYFVKTSGIGEPSSSLPERRSSAIFFATTVGAVSSFSSTSSPIALSSIHISGFLYSGSVG